MIIDWPIIAHPPMAPKNPFTRFAAPCAMHSLWVLVRRSVMSSTSCWVSSVSISPTAATDAANGKIVAHVSKVTGTFGT